jgi:glyoxylase-like metal-dependent hydrolase (beta-lactamase superfamily II)
VPAHSITLGDVEITRVIEWSGLVRAARVVFPDSDEETWRRNRRWLEPDFWTAADDAFRCHIQTWVLRSEGKTILVDTGVGDDRQRPQVPKFAGPRADYLARLREAGVAPEDVDVVVNTHLHYDHVGWNTELRGGEWVPTFPNATYLIPSADNVYFDPDSAHRSRAPRDEVERIRREGRRLVFNDSIAPVHRAGQAVLWQDTHRIDGNLLLEAAPGHTPGSSVLTLRSGTDRAVFVGDMLHSPVQLLGPTGTAASAKTPGSPPPPAAPSSPAPPNCASSSSPPTGPGTGPPRSAATATASPSPHGPPSRAADPDVRSARPNHRVHPGPGNAARGRPLRHLRPCSHRDGALIAR